MFSLNLGKQKIIVNYSKDELQENRLTDKITLFGGDKTNCMFGDNLRRGTRNV